MLLWFWYASFICSLWDVSASMYCYRAFNLVQIFEVHSELKLDFHIQYDAEVG